MPLLLFATVTSKEVIGSELPAKVREPKMPAIGDPATVSVGAKGLTSSSSVKVIELSTVMVSLLTAVTTKSVSVPTEITEPGLKFSPSPA